MKLQNIPEKINDYIKYGFTKKQVMNHIKYILYKKNSYLNYRPLWLLIYATDLCNLNCKMCPHHTNGNSNDFTFKKENTNSMSLKTFNQILERFPESTLLLLAGVGEPLLNKNIMQFIEIATKKNKTIDLTTNGILLNDDIIQSITTNKRFKKISISLNASNPIDYYNICGKDIVTFNKVVTNIEKLVKAKNATNSKIKIVVSAIGSEQFMPKVKDFIIFTDKLGVDSIDIFNYIDFSIIDKEEQWSDFSERFNDNLLRELYVYVNKKIKANVNLPIIKNKKNFKIKCEWYFKNIAFDAAGNIGSCGRVMNPNKDYGNLIDKNDIWNNQYMKQMRHQFMLDTTSLPNCCNNCIENYENNFFYNH